MTRKRILLHTCCAPCATASVERLLSENWEITLFFSNSNIYPRGEFQKRLDEVKKIQEIFRLPLLVDIYEHEKWLRAVTINTTLDMLGKEPEGGERCKKCFSFSLTRSALAAENSGIKAFSTTLTISPHKSSEQIFSAGSQFEGFLPHDFKKKNGFQRSVAMSKEYDLYRQHYCGCEFSRSLTQKWSDQAD